MLILYLALAVDFRVAHPLVQAELVQCSRQYFFRGGCGAAINISMTTERLQWLQLASQLFAKACRKLSIRRIHSFIKADNDACCSMSGLRFVHTLAAAGIAE